jgi:5-enolpyruvylshikimate-3-phosphate synthase
MKLLVRRATLVSRMRGGKDHAATPAAIQAEKAVRIAWEAGAVSFSKDPRFSRQLFTLLQDIKVLSKEQAEQTGSFTLSPSSRPVGGTITGPVSIRAAQMSLCLAACLGRPLLLDRVMLSTPLLGAINACTQAGGAITHEGHGPCPGRVSVTGGRPLSFSARTIFVGEDLFTVYLLAFLAIGQTGSCRFTGGAGLKGADLAPLRHALPLFGARLSHVVPHSQGLPVNLECSGQIPPVVMVPANLPFEGVCALLLAPLVWNTSVTLDLASLPASVATAALAEVRPLHRDAGAEVETHGSNLVYEKGPVNPPEQPLLPLDPILSAYLLALPAFTGGALTLTGRWTPSMPEAQEASQLLAWGGVTLQHDGNSISATAAGEAFRLPLQSDALSPDLGPLYLALLARRHALTGEERLPHDPPPFPQEDTDLTLAADFFSRLGLVHSRNMLCRDPDAGRDPAQNFTEKKAAPGMAGSGTDQHPQDAPRSAASGPTPDWTSPGALWGMAYALSASIRPGLKLANPGTVTAVMPSFWKLYNSLPNLVDPVRLQQRKTQETPGDDRPARRRVIAD